MTWPFARSRWQREGTRSSLLLQKHMTLAPSSMCMAAAWLFAKGVADAEVTYLRVGDHVRQLSPSLNRRDVMNVEK